MSRIHTFADEAGDFTFKDKAGASKYFIIGTVTMDDCALGEELQALRRELAFRGRVLETFHASYDRQDVRDEVFKLIAASNIRIDATILDKRKTQPHLVQNPVRFYKQAMFMHFKYVVPRVTNRSDELLVVASSLQIKKKKGVIAEAVEDVIDQVAHARRHVTAFHQANTDPCLQLADYATWAIQRRFEMNDDRSYDLIKHLVASEFQPFKYGSKTYY